MQPDAYISGFNVHQKDQFEQFKWDFQEANSNLLSRSHRLHLETNRRRKAFAQKKKAQMEKEERRYQAILAKRRQLIQEATEKFQRTHRVMKNSGIKGGSTKTDYALDEALHLIRGGRLTPPTTHNIHGYLVSRRPSSVSDDTIDDSRQGLRSSRSLFEQRLSLRQRLLASQQQVALRDFAAAAMGVGGAAPKSADTVSLGARSSNAGAKISAVAQQPACTSGVVTRHIGGMLLPRDGQKSPGAGSIGIVMAVPQYAGPRQNHDGPDNGQEHDSLMLCDSLEVATLKQTDVAENQGHLGTERFAESVNPLNSKPIPWLLHREDRNNNNRTLTTEQNVGSMAVDRASIANKVVNSIFCRADLLPNNDADGARESYRPNSGVSDGFAETSFPPQVNTGIRGIIPNRPLLVGVNGPSGDPTSRVGFLLHRNTNSPSPNIAIVQPTCHMNNFNAYEEQRNSRPEASDATLGLVDCTNTSLGSETGVAKLNGGNTENGRPSKRTCDLAPGQTVPDLGTFFVSGGPAKPQVIAPKSRGPDPILASDSSVGSLTANINESAVTGNRLVPTENEDLPSNAAAVCNKPPSGRYKSSEVVSSDLGWAGTVKLEVERGCVSAREKPRDIQSENARQPDGLEGDLQRMALRPMDANQKVINPQNSALLNNSAKCNKPNAAFPDDIHSDEASSNSSSTVGRAQTLTATVPKGILKTRPRGCSTSDGRSQVQSGGVKSSGSATDAMSVSFRDSLEVIKLHRKDEESIRPTEKNQKLKKKSVRFAEILCEEEPNQSAADADSQGTQIFFVPRPPLQGKDQIEPPASSRPTRPISAKVLPVTSPVDPDVKVPRVASAGVTRRGPFYNPTAHSNPAQQPTNTSNAISTQPPASLAGTHQVTALSLPSTFTASGRLEHQMTRDFGELSLDRTPTEEEINRLWQRVRNCLNREPSSMSTANSSRIPVIGNGGVSSGFPTQLPSRQTSAVSCANFDGSALTSQLRPERTKTTYINNFGGPQCPTKRITMEMLDAFTKKTNNNFPQQQRTIIHPNVSSTVASNEPSTGEPRATNVVGRQHASSNSQVTSVTGRNPATSALSLEEERLMESINRLNEKLIGHAASRQQYSNQPLVNRPLVPKPRPFSSTHENYSAWNS